MLTFCGQGVRRRERPVPVLGTRIPPDSYRHLVPEVGGRDPDDDVHMAAAVAAGADALVTWNRKDFTCDFIRNSNVQVVDPDDYLCSLWDEFPDEVVETIRRLAAEKRRPSLTPEELVGYLERAGVPAFASKVRERMNLAARRRAALEVLDRILRWRG
jgi:hypothetical protein